MTTRSLMKLLFLEPNGPQNHPVVETLRNTGVGVMYARNIQDAQIFLHAHAPSLDAVVTNDDGRQWVETLKTNPETTGLAFLLATNRNATESLKHQNSQAGANAYLKSPIQVKELQSVLDKVIKSHHKPKSEHEQPTGVFLEEVDSSFSAPARDQTSINFDAPTITLSGPAKPQPREEVEAISYEDASEQELGAELSVDEFELTDAVNPAEFTRTAHVESTGMEELPTELAASFTGFDRRDVDRDEDLIETQESIEMPLAQDLATKYADLRSGPIADPRIMDPDEETIRKYLALREQDVSVLSTQLRATQERLKKMEDVLKMERARNAELAQLAQLQEEKLKHYDQEKKIEMEVVHQQLSEMEDRLREKTEKSLLLETKVKHAADEIRNIKERVKIDIRRIRVREKELENQLEILKKDSSSLILARDEKILELKRKLDTLEFNMELVQEKYSRERDMTDQFRQKVKDAADAMKRAGGFLIEDAS